MASKTLRELLTLIEEHAGPEGLNLERADLQDLDAGLATIQAELARAQATQPAWLSPRTGGLNLAKAILRRANLSDADLRGADLGEADLEGAVLADASLRQANLQGARLTAANLTDADLQHANLAQADLTEAVFHDADLRGASLAGASLRAAQAKEADLRQADLQGASLEGADLEDADLRNANLSGASLRAARLHDADLRDAVLEGVDLSQADLEGARLDGGRGRHGSRGRHGADWAAFADQVQAEVMAGLGEWASQERVARFADEVRAGVEQGLGAWMAPAAAEAAGPAGERASWSIPRESATAFHLSIGLGTIRLVGEARDDILLRCTPEARQELEIARSAGAIHVRQRERMGLNWPHRIDVDLALPQALEQLDVRSGFGGIHGRAIAARVRLATGKGNIRFEESRLEGEVHTGYGNVTLADVRGLVVVRTGNGNVLIQRAERARLTISTGRGNIRLEGGQLQEVRAHTGLGDIYSACALGLGPGECHINTGAGVITVELGEGQAAQVEANTGMGQVVSDWPLVRVGRPGRAAMGSMRMVGTIGKEAGRAILVLKSGAGNIFLKRGSAPDQAAPAQPSQPAEATSAAAPAPVSDPVDSAPATTPHAQDARLAILESLARGEINADEAEELINKLGA